ncbi:MAG: hypothetical protein ABI840_03800 [bacterium]
MHRDEQLCVSTLKKSFLFGALFFSLIGAGLALYATNLTFKLTVTGIIDPSGCIKRNYRGRNES